MIAPGGGKVLNRRSIVSQPLLNLRMSQQNKRIFEFGPYSIDTLNRQLMRDGEVVPLKAKAVDTLLLLIEHNGDVVEKDDLMQALWPDSFVEEANLTQNIYTLRKALGGDYIETIPRRGYRFIAPVKEPANGSPDVIVIQERTRTSVSYEVENGVGPAEALEIAKVIDVTSQVVRELPAARQARSSLRWFLVGLALIAIIVAGVTVFLRLRIRSPFASVKLTKLTTTGKAVKAAISPDGKYVAYVLNDSGQQGVWLRQLVTGTELQIVSPEQTDIYGLTFTRDGNYVFYVSQKQNLLAVLYQVPTLGGAPDKLIEDVDSPVTFSPDNRQMAFLRFSPGKASIVIANTNGTAERVLVTTLQSDAVRIGPNGVLPPAWSPDGSIIAAPVSINATQWNQTIYGYRTTDGAQVQITTNHWPALGRIEWLPDGSGLLATIVETEANSDQQIWIVPYQKGEARRITNDLTDYRDVSVTADARTILTIQSEKKANIWLAATADLDHPKQLTSTSYDGLNGVTWTPDGRLVYTSWIGGEQNVWITDPNGGSPKQLTSHAGFNEQPVVSPDGRYIVFLSNRNNHEHLWRVDIDGRNPIELTHGTSDRQATFTPDGQAIIYRTLVPPSLRRVSINGGQETTFLAKASFDPNVSPDGKTVACGYRPQPAAKNQIALIDASGGEPKTVHDFPACYGRMRWMPDGNGLAYAARQQGVGNIWVQPLDGSAPKQLTHWSANPIFSFGWSPDGKWLAYASGSITSDVVVISDQRQ
jgi:Tol biopolymer transport system component/DNA-binding winged helix-turn-helix (wHTH) protein